MTDELKVVIDGKDFECYSTERNIVSTCKEKGVDFRTKREQIEEAWDLIFKDGPLHKTMPSSKPVIASWLRSVLIVHEIRQILSSTPIIGTIGLSNTGKSTFLQKAFTGVPTKTGEKEESRTTVPRLYTLQNESRFSVMDLPGADDSSQDVTMLVDIAVGLCSVLVVIVKWSGITLTAKDFIEKLLEKNVPFIICLNHADSYFKDPDVSIYIDSILKGNETETEKAYESLKLLLDREKKECLKKFQLVQISEEMCWLTAFNLDKWFPLKIEHLNRVGIRSAHDVRDWAINKMKEQGIIAEKLANIDIAAKISPKNEADKETRSLRASGSKETLEPPDLGGPKKPKISKATGHKGVILIAMPKKDWVADVDAIKCMRCSKPFNKLRRRQHHCRICGQVFL